MSELEVSSGQKLLCETVAHFRSKFDGSDALLFSWMMDYLLAEPGDYQVAEPKVFVPSASSDQLETDLALARSRITELEQENAALETINEGVARANAQIQKQTEELRSTCLSHERTIDGLRGELASLRTIPSTPKESEPKPAAPAVDLKHWTFPLSRRQVIEIVGQLGQKTNYEAIVQDFGVSKESVISVAQTWGRAVGQMRAQTNILTRDEIFEAFKRKIMTEYAEAA